MLSSWLACSVRRRSRMVPTTSSIVVAAPTTTPAPRQAPPCDRSPSSPRSTCGRAMRSTSDGDAHSVATFASGATGRKPTPFGLRRTARAPSRRSSARSHSTAGSRTTARCTGQPCRPISSTGTSGHSACSSTMARCQCACRGMTPSPQSAGGSSLMRAPRCSTSSPATAPPRPSVASRSRSSTNWLT